MILVFGGYMLIYASVAKQGAFATEPWAGLFADAYQDLPRIATDTQAVGAAALDAAAGKPQVAPGQTAMKFGANSLPAQ